MKDEEERRADTAERVRRHRFRMKQRRQLIRVEIDEEDLFKLYRYRILVSNTFPVDTGEAIQPESFWRYLSHFDNDDLARAVADAVKQLIRAKESRTSNDITNDVGSIVTKMLGAAHSVV